ASSQAIALPERVEPGLRRSIQAGRGLEDGLLRDVDVDRKHGRATDELDELGDLSGDAKLVVDALKRDLLVALHALALDLDVELVSETVDRGELAFDHGARDAREGRDRAGGVAGNRLPEPVHQRADEPGSLLALLDLLETPGERLLIVAALAKDLDPVRLRARDHRDELRALLHR